ncbi:MAG TPA: TonB-dependent receptor [Pyrinomonadaceae bacterium]|nr:TonB-dependent receptor [Pyrinomonadaceae bacterium]
MKSLKPMKASNKRRFSLFTGLFMAAILSTMVVAQTGVGTVSGTIRDSQHAVVAKADVTITNVDTSVARRSKSSEEGVFHFGGLTPGRYTLVVEITGFKKWSSSVTLQVGQTVAIEPVLELGDVTTTVEVAGVAPPISTETADVSDVKDYQRIRQLPLNGRNISALFDLTPGIEGGGNARVNGLKVGSLEITLDGISLVDRFGGGISRVQPGLDTVQEFRVETVGSDARFSRPATVTLATRSGTNEFHGTAFETHRNNAAGLLARRRENPVDFKPPKLIRNEFGVSAGGPLFVPRFGEGGKAFFDGRNKSFWFAAYEGLRSRESALPLSGYGAVPTAAMWGGDLSNAVDANGDNSIIYDPLTSTGPNGVRQPFPNNIIPANRISAFAKVMQSLTALPTNNNNPYLADNIVKFYPVKNDSDNLTVKVDHNFSQSDTLSVRWTRSTRKAATEGGVFGNPINVDAGLGTSRSDSKVNNISITQTHTFTPSLVNELLVGMHRSYKSSGTLADFTDWPSRLGTPNPFGAKGWPTLGDDWFSWDSDNRKDEALTGGILEDNVTWNKGQHSIQFGGKYRREWNNIVEFQQAQGSHDFDGRWTALYAPNDNAAAPFTGNGFASLLLGLPSFLSNQYNRGFFYFRQSEKGLYFTDRWKVTPRLTLTLGMRWDNWTPYREKYNRLVTADTQSVATKFEVLTPGNNQIQNLPGIPPAVLASWSARGLTYATADAVGYPDNLYRPDNNNFGPRLGMAFKLNNKMVLRGGYGEYFWTMPLSQLLQAARTNPPLNLRFDNRASDRNATFNYPLIARPVGTDFIGGATVNTQGIVPISSAAQGIMVWDGRNWKDGRAQSWHLTLERELPFKTALRVSYIGEHGRDLEQKFALNSQEAQYNYVLRTKLAPPSNSALLRANPNWNVSNAVNRTGYSNTHSGQVELERRFASGLAFQWFYVFTSSLTTTDAPGFDSGNTNINSVGGGGQVPENIQLYGNPNLSYDERLRLVYFRSTTIPPHRIRYNAIYDLPFGRGKKIGGGASGFLNQVIGGWQLATIGDWKSGNRMSVASSLYQFGDVRIDADNRPEMTIFGLRQRLWFRGDFNPASATNVTGGNLTALVPLDRGQRVARQLGPNFNNQIPLTLANGTVRNVPIGELYNYSPRANLLGPGAWNVDMALFKNIKFGEHRNLRFSADFFNFFNHPNDVAPNTTTGLQNLGVQANNPRTIQLSLRAEW